MCPLFRESADILSVTMQSPDGQPLAAVLPGQYIVVRLQRDPGGPPLFRSYSLSKRVPADRYRISVKIEPNGVAGTWLRDHLSVGDTLDISSPRGSFTLQTGEQPVVLLSAGIGVTPVLAMLRDLATAQSTRQVFWVYAARDGQHHPFRAEVRSLTMDLPHCRSYVCYSSPTSSDKLGEDFDAAGHLSRSGLRTGRRPGGSGRLPLRTAALYERVIVAAPGGPRRLDGADSHGDLQWRRSRSIRV